MQVYSDASLGKTLSFAWTDLPIFWSREVWTLAARVRLLTVMVLLFACSWVGIILSHQSEGVATIWLTNGVLFGVMITRPRREWLGYLLGGLTADTLADVVYGDPFRLAIGVSVANSIEVIVSLMLLTRFIGHPLNLAKPRTLFAFLSLSALLATAICSVLGALWTNALTSDGPTPFFPMFRAWYLGDVLGMALLAPLTFMLRRPGLFAIFRQGNRLATFLLLLVPPVVTAIIFTDSKDPLIFFLFPVLLLMVFRLGFSGTVFAIFAIAFESIAFTVKGHGPLMLVRGEHMLLHRVVLVQLFLAVAVFSTFPVAAMLEERADLGELLASSEDRYRRLAHSDDLTKLHNRRAFNLYLEQQWTASVLTQQALALLMVDADHFKSYNDLYGHLAGDTCLCALAACIAEAAGGTTGFVARYGGEEFAVVLAGASLEQACLVAERICAVVRSAGLIHEGIAAGRQTVSIGVASVRPNASSDSRELISAADNALYRAKGEGRDCIRLHMRQEIGEAIGFVSSAVA